MVRSFKKAVIAIASSLMLLTGFAPSQAMQMPVGPQLEKSGDVQNVQYCRRYRPGYRPGYDPGYRPGPAYRPAYRPGWYGGYQGYSYYRPGYRQYNGYWYPLAAFGAGAVIGGAIASQPRYAEPAGSAHVEWCQSRYRSYRAYDNTFQPNSGPRRQCVSPY
jgi:hypothetical protein